MSISQKIASKVISNSEIAEKIFLLSVKGNFIDQNILPGNFANILCNGKNETFLRRPLSIYEKSGDEIKFLYKVIGRGTENLSNFHLNDVVDLIIPCGNSFEIPFASNILLIAGGMGIAPINYLLKEILTKLTDVNIYLFYGVLNKNEMIDIDNLKYKNVKILTHIDYLNGINNGNLFDYYIKNEPDEFDNTFICGPKAMIKRFLEYFISRKKSVQISLETNMGCGFGVCLGCSIKTINGMKTICKDGPVFNAEDIIFEVL